MLRVRWLPIVCPAGIDDVLELVAGVGAEAELTARRKSVEVAIDLHGEVAEAGVGVPEQVVLGFLGGEDSAVVHVESFQLSVVSCQCHPDGFSYQTPHGESLLSEELLVGYEFRLRLVVFEVAHVDHLF